MIKNLTEIEKRQLKKSKNLAVLTSETKNTQFSNNNCLKVLEVSFLRQICNMDEEKILDSKSIIGLKVNFDDIDNDDIMTIFLTTDVEGSQEQKKKDEQTNCTNEKKRENLSDKVFHYIYIAQYYQHFLLA